MNIALIAYSITKRVIYNIDIKRISKYGNILTIEAHIVKE